MKVLVINSGSSSIKFQLFNMDNEEVLASGVVEEIATSNSKFKFEANGKEIKEARAIQNHEEGMTLINNFIKESGIVNSLNELDGIGHRVVHGGEKFIKSCIITDEVIKEIEDLCALAPLHNPAHLAGIRSAMANSKDVKHVAVFDTAFHQSMPKEAYLYATPYEYYEKYNVRRYGFHGTSHKYVSEAGAKFLGKDLQEFNAITLHIGNGASACAIKNGKCIDTSMGLSPLEGLIMGTRSGDVDATVLACVADKENKNTAELFTILNKKSGLLGICGTNDMRDVEDGMLNGDERKKLAFDMFCYRITKYVGSYWAAIGKKLDAIIFTAGIGENSDLVRKAVCDNLSHFGIKINYDINAKREKIIRKISTDDSSVDVLIVPTNEELAIAKDVVNLVK